MTLCALPLISALLSSCATPPPLATGYVEGEHVMIAPVSVAEVASLSVTRGQRVRAGAELAAQEDRDARIAIDQATAALAQAESQLANLRLPRRARRRPNRTAPPCGLRRWKRAVRRRRRSARMRRPC